jgi:hypothetical protein
MMEKSEELFLLLPTGSGPAFFTTFLVYETKLLEIEMTIAMASGYLQFALQIELL